MKFLTAASALTLFFALLTSSTAAEADETCSDDEVCSPPASEPSECKLYIAPSTIPNAGLGIFTAVPVAKDEYIGYGDVILPIIDLEWHTGTSEFFNPFFNRVYNIGKCCSESQDAFFS